MVTLLEYGQVVYGGDAQAEALPPAPAADTPSANDTKAQAE
jgi:hypothetical protein